MIEPGLRDWKNTTPVDARQWLKEAKVAWWIAGGWALDLFSGHSTRRHADMDVGCFRGDDDDDDDDGDPREFEFEGDDDDGRCAVRGVEEMTIHSDGRFEIEVEDLDLRDVDLDFAPFCLQIGNRMQGVGIGFFADDDDDDEFEGVAVH